MNERRRWACIVRVLCFTYVFEGVYLKTERTCIYGRNLVAVLSSRRTRINPGSARSTVEPLDCRA